ncbi:MAG: hypothetical protein EBX36_05565, partial [Planctomycetia bacterium]|nr:hypothetical protein [Planctomycetia bacterium]
TTFTVSDKFAGRTGPCPKCKQPITVPSDAVKEVKIHGPEEEAARPGRAPMAPIVFVEHAPPTSAYLAIGVVAMALAMQAVLARLVWGPGQSPVWVPASLACLAAMPCAWLGYQLVRDRDLEPYFGRPLLLRTAICGTAYAMLWLVKDMLPAELTREMWAWVYLGPPFFLAGALAAIATLDLDWGTGVAHFSLYVMFVAFIRWIAGFLPL